MKKKSHSRIPNARARAMVEVNQLAPYTPCFTRRMSRLRADSASPIVDDNSATLSEDAEQWSTEETASLVRAHQLKGNANTMTNGMKFNKLLQNWDKTLHDAATVAGISDTQAKKICRENGLWSWPHRSLGVLKNLKDEDFDYVEKNNGIDSHSIKTLKQDITDLQTSQEKLEMLHTIDGEMPLVKKIMRVMYRKRYKQRKSATPVSWGVLKKRSAIRANYAASASVDKVAQTSPPRSPHTEMKCVSLDSDVHICTNWWEDIYADNEFINIDLLFTQ